MSVYDFEGALRMRGEDYGFRATLFYLFMKADDTNLTRLQFAFPDAWEEFDRRRRSPGGLLPSERQRVPFEVVP